MSTCAVIKEIEQSRRERIANYPIIRKKAEQLWAQSEPLVSSQKLQQLRELNRDIKKKYLCMYQVTYQLRDGQTINMEPDHSGGYEDSWYNEEHYGMTIATSGHLEDKEIDIQDFFDHDIEEDEAIQELLDTCEDDPLPIPGEPVTIFLIPDWEEFHPIPFFSTCMVKDCQSSIGGPHGQFLVCDHHIELLPTITPQYLAQIRNSNLNRKIKEAQQFLTNGDIQEPEPVITLEIIGDIVDDELIKSTVYIDLISSKKIVPL